MPSRNSIEPSMQPLHFQSLHSHSIIFSNNTTSKLCWFIDYYRPKSDMRFHVSEASQQILRLKDGCNGAVNYFSQRFIPHVPGSIVLIAAPGHAQGPACPNGGLRRLLANVCASIYKVHDLSDYLERRYDVQKSSTANAGNRLSREEHYQSLDFLEPGILNGENVWLIDDVLTRGATLRACRQAIIESNPSLRSLTWFSLTKTSRSIEPLGMPDNDIPF